MTNLDSILKSRDITLPTKVCLVNAMVFPVVMYGCESWIVKKAEHQKIDAFELWCWRRLLRVPWTARGSNQSVLREISPGCSLEGLMLKLKLQYFGHLMWRVDSLEKTLLLGGIGSRRRRGRQRMRWLDGIIDSMDMILSKLWVGDGQGGLACCNSWGRKESDTTERLNCTELMPCSGPLTLNTKLICLHLVVDTWLFLTLTLCKPGCFKKRLCSISGCMHACMLSHFSCFWLFATPWTIPHQANLSMGFSRQESGLIFPSPGTQDWVLTQGLNPRLLCLLHWQVGSLPLAQPGKP